MDKQVVEINQLKKYYGDARGIEEVTFAIESGEIFGFIGPNGAGKTTTIRTLLALIHPDGGTAKIFGQVTPKDFHAIAKDIGYLPSENYFYEKMKVKELLNYAADLYDKDCTDRIKELAQRLQLDLDRKIEDLSSGNKKKVSIVAALLHQPKLLILDEPTSHLDPLVKQTLFEILIEENEKGTSILFSSHVLSEVQKICDRVAFIKEGKIIKIDSISELRKKGYKKIELTTDVPINKDYFNIGDIADYVQQDQIIKFIFRGDVSLLIKKINKLDIADIFIEEPTLEEIFLHYYE